MADQNLLTFELKPWSLGFCASAVQCAWMTALSSPADQHLSRGCAFDEIRGVH